ncbi:MAG: ATP-binding protein [Candidatus Omnitrophica bacterium CG1_02_49_10]|nr:MAG: ATP-binding protein [Candidatus Omnitrophica bacterium CG1_02_49_10]
MPESVIFTWSGGKDSAMALYELKKANDYSVAALFTTVTEDYGRVSMHGVRNELLASQARSLGMPLKKVSIAKDTSNGEYESKMKESLLAYKARGISHVAFGDIFLEDLRRYREDNLARMGMKAIFPIWKRATPELAKRFIGLGFKAVTTCVDSKALDKGFVGREFNETFLSELPAGVDPCGENGEFHTFVYDGPIFKEPVSFRKGETVLRDERFYFHDLIPLGLKKRD